MNSTQQQAPPYLATRDPCVGHPANQVTHMGYSMRTAEWRYTLWLRWDNATLAAEWDGESVDELYAHAGDDSTDMDAWENTNLAGDAAYADTTAALRARLRAQFAP